jgi:hypothetical protein
MVIVRFSIAFLVPRLHYKTHYATYWTQIASKAGTQLRLDARGNLVALNHVTMRVLVST